MIIVITGPTALGKSKTAIEVAKTFDAEIVNGDAFQIYQELDIGVAKPSKDELSQVTHHLYSLIPVTDSFSIFTYIFAFPFPFLASCTRFEIGEFPPNAITIELLRSKIS